MRGVPPQLRLHIRALTGTSAAFVPSTVLAAVLLTAALLTPALWAPPTAAEEFGDPGARMRAYWRDGQLVVGVYPLANEGYINIARRVMENPDAYPDIAALNRNMAPQQGRPINFPIATLLPHLRGQALRALYPEDELTERGWAHRVTDPLESLIQLTEAYTGSKSRFRQLAAYNKLKNPDVLRLGDQVTIPLHWIPEELSLRPLQLKGPLQLHKDAKSGRLYAHYEVQPNDTLYSLVLRFTDREHADEVNRISRLLMGINAIQGESGLQAGRTLRLPVEWLSDEWRGDDAKPGSAADSVAANKPTGAGSSEEGSAGDLGPARGISPPTPAPPKRNYGPAKAGARALHVILDAGHGGSDPGAVYGTSRDPDHVFEHEVVYDVALRAERLLKAKGYAVYPTVEDLEQLAPLDVLSTDGLGGERVRVTPPYRMDSAKAAVNLRVFLINSLYRGLIKQRGIAPDDVVLISIHGDALAPTLRGAMVYYPDHRLRATDFAPRGQIYRIRQEAVPAHLSFGWSDNRYAEGVSRTFGEFLMRSFEDSGLGVAKRRPVRSYYYRDGERTLPAVLRYSQVPTSILVEVANLNNRQDRKRMLQGPERERVAQALAGALDYLRYAPQNAAPQEAEPRVARTSG